MLVKKQQCGHRSVCDRPRALKKNGERHWLCEHHRQQQNAIQRHRRRQQVATRRMVKNKSKLRGDPASDSSAATAQRTQESSPVHSSQQSLESPNASHARFVQDEASSADRCQSTVIPKALVSVLKAQRDELVRRTQADELFLQRFDEMWAAHLRRLE